MTSVDDHTVAAEELQQQKTDQPTSTTVTTGNCVEGAKMEGGEGKVREKETWRCPDPGCKKANIKSDNACSQCTLPRQSAQQFKRGGQRGGGGGRGGGRGGRGGGGRGFRNWGGRGGGGGHHRRVPDGIDLTNPTIIQFREHATELDKKHDKHERIVKISRDITIESKKIIFLLHRITREEEKPATLADAEHKLGNIRHRLWKSLAYELRGEDPFQFLRAYSGGLQEYIEALSFYYYICYGRLIPWDEVQNDLKFDNRRERKPKVDSKVSCGENGKEEVSDTKSGSQREEADKPKISGGPQKEADVDSDASSNSVVEKLPGKVMTVEAAIASAKDEKPGSEAATAVRDDSSCCSTEPADEEEHSCVVSKKNDMLEVFVPKVEFVLGLADLTGEVMRQAITLVGAGETDVCFELLQFLHEIYDGFLAAACYGGNREMVKKTQVLEQSLRKVENACYTINVRGSEVPKHLLATYFKTGEDFNPEQAEKNSTFSDD